MKLLVLGGTGVISRAIVKQALLKNIEVAIVNRGTRSLDFGGAVQTITADRTAPDFALKLKDIHPDVVIDMICFTPKDAEQTVSIFGARAKQLVFTSSVAAYQRPYKSLPTAEDMESLTTDPVFDYGFQKAEFERFLLSRIGKINAGITVIRPSITFGPGARNFGTLRQNINVVHRIKAGKPLVMFGETTFPWSFTYVDDLAAGFVAAAGNEKTFNSHFQVLNDEVVMWEDLYMTIGKLFGLTPRILHVPSELLCRVDKHLMGHLYYEKAYCSVFSISKFRQAAPEWKPRYTYKEGIAKVIDSWQEEKLEIDVEKDKLEDRIIECYDTFAASLAALNTGQRFAHSFK